MKKSISLLTLVILSNFVLFIGIQWPLLKTPSGQLLIIGPLYNILSSYIVDAILHSLIIILILIFNGLLAILISMKLKNLMINFTLLSRIYFVSSIILNVPFSIAALVLFLNVPIVNTPNASVVVLASMFVVIMVPFFSVASFFWGLWLYFWLKIKNRPVFIGTLLSAIAVFIILASLGVTFYKDFTLPECDPKSGRLCVIPNPL